MLAPDKSEMTLGVLLCLVALGRWFPQPGIVLVARAFGERRFAKRRFCVHGEGEDWLGALNTEQAGSKPAFQPDTAAPGPRWPSGRRAGLVSVCAEPGVDTSLKAHLPAITLVPPN